MDQPGRTEDPDIEAVGRQEGAGGNVNGGSRNWMQRVKLRIDEEAKGVPHLRRFDDQIDSSNKQRPSIFRPRRQVAVGAVAAPVPVTAQRRSQLQSTTSRGSTGGNVIVAAVGPYHQSSEPLITRAKKCAIVEFLARPEFALDTDAFLVWARGNDARARGCYEPDDSLTRMRPEELAEMHLLDGCLVLFAVFLLRKWSPRKGQRRPYPSCLAADISASSASTRTRCRSKLAQDFINLSADISQHMKQTRLDLLLVGNQIPFFVLEELHSQLKGTLFLDIKRSIKELALSCFHDIRPCPSTGLLLPTTVVHHLLHLFHLSRVPPGKHAVDDGSQPLLGEPESNLPCATWFEDSHIGFSTHAAAPGTLHMDFRRSMLGARGVLRVPALHIHDYSALVFHNLIAFEQGHLRCGLGATTYCICMARLLQSEADAKLLRRRGILAHTHETDEEIVALFRGLAEEYRHASYSRDLLDLCGDVEAHHHSRAAKAVKFVKLQCFPRQTVTFFVILGALISIATLVNTIISVYRFYHPYINH